ncbi:MAG: HAD hydrolase family protein [Candidatus Margulisiibacteriota bacterium]|nr:HAD hydrolase family protein [Candidatus Margulisiibacteriota bacterium]
MTLDFSKIKFVVFDFDGVFTNNLVMVSEKGEESVVCNRSDGIGLSKLKNIGIDLMILSTEVNGVVKKRAEKLKIYCVNACEDKLNKLEEEVQKKFLTMEEVAFMGNDINDLECLKSVGLPIVVADAHKDVLGYAKYTTKNKGGCGAVREVCDMIAAVKVIENV